MKGFNHGAFTVKKKKVFKNTVIGLSIPLFVFVASRGIR